MLTKYFYPGLILSAPAGFLILMGFADGTEPTGWIMFGLAALLGLPWNIAILFVAFSLIYLLFKIFEATQYFPSFNIDTDGWLIMMYILIGAAVIGAHINGFILMKKHNKSLNTAPKSDAN